MGFCASCGVDRTSADERFCRSCGHQHQAAAVPPLSTPPPSAPPAWTPPAYAAAPPPAGEKPGRSAGLLLAVVGTVLAVLIGAFLAWQFVWPRGGAGSPEEAVEKLITASASQDPLAVLDVIAPAEVEGLGDLIAQAKDRAEDEGLVGEEQLSDAVEVEITDLEFEVDELGDDLARVAVVDGEYDVSWDPDDLPERLSFLEDESDEESESGDLSEVLDGDEPYVTTVKVDGRWYVTALGTIAEYAYDEAEDEVDVDRPEYDAVGEDVEPITGDDPEDVIATIFETISKSDAEGVLASLPGDLGVPLRPYVSLVEDALSGRYSDGALSLDLTVDDLDLSTEDLDGDRVRVTIQGGTFTGTAGEAGQDSDTSTVTVDGRCVTGSGDGFVTYDSYREDGYYDDYGYYHEGEYVSTESSDPQTWCLGGDDEAAEVLSDLDIDDFFVVMRKVDGGFQLDPVATVAEYAAIALEALDEGLVDDLIDRWEDEV